MQLVNSNLSYSKDKENMIMIVNMKLIIKSQGPEYLSLWTIMQKLYKLDLM